MPFRSNNFVKVSIFIFAIISTGVYVYLRFIDDSQSHKEYQITIQILLAVFLIPYVIFEVKGMMSGPSQDVAPTKDANKKHPQISSDK